MNNYCDLKSTTTATQCCHKTCSCHYNTNTTSLTRQDQYSINIHVAVKNRVYLDASVPRCLHIYGTLGRWHTLADTCTPTHRGTCIIRHTLSITERKSKPCSIDFFHLSTSLGVNLSCSPSVKLSDRILRILQFIFRPQFGINLLLRVINKVFKNLINKPLAIYILEYIAFYAVSSHISIADTHINI